MAWLWITISWIITAVSICIVCLIKRNMRQAARSIREIVQTNTTQQLLLSVPQKDTEALFKEIQRPDQRQNGKEIYSMRAGKMS